MIRLLFNIVNSENFLNFNIDICKSSKYNESHAMENCKNEKLNNYSYREKLRDWPDEVSATTCFCLHV